MAKNGGPTSAKLVIFPVHPDHSFFGWVLKFCLGLRQVQQNIRFCVLFSLYSSVIAQQVGSCHPELYRVDKLIPCLSSCFGPSGPHLVHFAPEVSNTIAVGP
jgi:hypothetical protein